VLRPDDELGAIVDAFLAKRERRGLPTDPHHCRIEIARWEAFSGLKAEKVAD